MPFKKFGMVRVNNILSNINYNCITKPIKIVPIKQPI